MLFMRTGERNVGQCLLALVTIGSIDRHIVLLPKSFFVSLVFIIGIVTIRFVVAVMFQWFFSWKLGNFMRETYEQCMQRSAEIENLFSNIYHPTRSRYCPRIGKDGLRKKENCKIFSPNTFTFIFSEAFFKGSDGRRKTPYGMLYFSLNPDWKHSTMYGYSHLQTNRFREAVSLPGSAFVDSICLFSLINVPQPPPKYKLFSFPSLIQYICSLPIPDRWGSLHCFWLLDGDLVIADG